MSNYDRDKAYADLEEMGDIDPEEIYDRVTDKGFEERMRESGLNPDNYRDGNVDNSNGNVDSGCFLTTACIMSKGLRDDCKELTTLRLYRDMYLKAQNHGEEEIEEYYRIAPLIVEAINNSNNAKEIWNKLYDKLVVPSVLLIEKGDYERAHELYKSYVLKLKAKYLKEEVETLTNNYARILEDIKTKEYEKCHRRYWGGAGALFISDPEDHRINDRSLEVFVTKNVSSVVWLVESIKRVANVDYLSKYALYPKLAVIGREYEKAHGDFDVEGLLKAMLESVEEFIK